MSEIIAKSDDWAYLCQASDVPENGIGQAMHPNGLQLAVYNVAGEFFVTSDQCTHGSASFFEEGELVGFTVECGWHNGTFDVRTGEAKTMPCRVPLRSFSTKLEDGAVYITPKPNKPKNK